MSRTWTIVERTRTELLGFDASWIPEGLAERVRIVMSGSRLAIEVDGWVGSARLLNGDQLRIVSKYGEFNYLRMLARVMDIPEPDSDEVDYGMSHLETPTVVFGKAFARSLATVLERGVATSFRDVESRSTYVPRRLDVTRTALSMRLDRHPLTYGSNRQRTERNDEHAVLGAAAAQLAENSTRLSKREFEIASSVERRWNKTHTNLIGAIQAVESKLRRNFYTGSRAYYIAALRQALLILGATGATATDGAIVSGDAMLTNSDLLFEEYVRKLLAEALTPYGYTVGKAVAGEQYLFLSGKIALTPDIVVRRGTRVAAVADVKHKSPDPGDYYQTLAYAREWGMPSVWMFQATSVHNNIESLKAASDGTEVVRVELPVLHYDILEESVRNMRSRLASH